MSAAENARRDLKETMKLEASLEKKLRRLFKNVVSDYAKTKARTGNDIDASPISQQIQLILSSHYGDIASYFGKNSQRNLPKKLRLTEEEQENLSLALDNYFLTRSVDQTRIIVESTNENINKSSEKADEIAAAQFAENGKHLSIAEKAMIGAATLSRLLAARSKSISITETHSTAETVKESEVFALAGQQPRIVSQSSAYPGVNKEWVTVGDDAVRPAHREADGQIVPANESFTVGGQQLAIPGDTSLGATADNVINCRCKVAYPTDEIIAQRERLLNIEVVVFEPIVRQ